jgi:proline iminopeptidase
MTIHRPPRADLFPPFDANHAGYLDVGDGHRLWWEESGAPDGIPVVFLHGGPGAGCAPTYRRFFDPSVYRIILFDQRGSGRSKPYASVEANDTQKLIADIEALRSFMKIDRWLIFGGSWGSTLALAYGQAHPGSCLGFILRGIFLGADHEVEWFLYGMARVFPEAHRTLAAHIPATERRDLLTAYAKRLMSDNRAEALAAARVWGRYESQCSTLRPTDMPMGAESGEGLLAIARIEAHYFVHNLFLEEGQLLCDLHRITHLPCAIIQGRYDMICPPGSADALAADWPGADYVIVDDAGHSAMEPGIRTSLVRATEAFKARLRLAA